MDKNLFVLGAAVIGALAVFYFFVLSGDSGDTVPETTVPEVTAPVSE